MEFYDDRPWALPTFPTPGLGRRKAPVATWESNTPVIDLSGTWRFLLHESATPEGYDENGELLPPSLADPHLDDSLWETIEVPSHWVLTGDGERGLPWYTNVQYPIPVDPPFVPDLNPTADYRRTFTVPESWNLDLPTTLRFHGVESFAAVWVNGTWVASTQGSRLMQDVDVSGLIHHGENCIAVRVSQWSPGTYCEDQDQWWLPGIFRTIELRGGIVHPIHDVWVRSDYDPATATGSLDIELHASEQAYPVTIGVSDCHGKSLCEYTVKKPGPITIDVGDVSPWSAESPTLYTVTLLSALCPEGNTTHEVSVRTGFTRIEIIDGQVRANGHKLFLRGVNRHEVHRDHGRVFDAEWVRQDLMLMKAMNVNAIRTSHYPPHPGVLDLCDELGFWVMDECDYETHGFELVGWQGNPSEDPQWREVLLDRMRRTVERDKNHPSIFSWSLGNESFTGSNLAAMAQWAKQRDPGRIVHYERDYAGSYTQIHSRMYPTLEEVDSVLDGYDYSTPDSSAGTQGPIGHGDHPSGHIAPGQAAHARTLPYLLVEYAHAMGTGPGGVEEYVQRFNHPRHLGGFVWEWRDHALVDPRPDQNGALRYGGDFGESVHDGNFVCDGLVDAYCYPRSGATAWANAVAPVSATPYLDEDNQLRLHVVNHFQHAGTENLSLLWQLLDEEGSIISTGRTGLPPMQWDSEEHLSLGELPPAENLPTCCSLTTCSSPVIHADGETWADDHPLSDPDSPVDFIESLAKALKNDKPAYLHIAVLDHVHPGICPSADPACIDPSTGAHILPTVGRQYGDARVMSVREMVIPAKGPSHGTYAPSVASKAEYTAEGTLQLGPVTLDRQGRFLTLDGASWKGPEVCIWRAPTDNDNGHNALDYRETAPTRANVGGGRGYGGPSSAEGWRDERFHLLQTRHLSTDIEGDGSLVMRHRCGAPSRGWAMDMTTRWAMTADGLRMRVELEPNTAMTRVLPRIGVRMGLPEGPWHTYWNGLGPMLSYPDMKGGSFHGTFSAPSHKMWERTVTPQEAGTRMDTQAIYMRRVPGTHPLFTAEGKIPTVVAIRSDRHHELAFSVCPWDVAEVSEAGHIEELPESDRLWLHLDAVVHGIGSHSCGPDVRPEYQASTRTATIDVTISTTAMKLAVVGGDKE
ncbi:glycoside hydrolase family 2 TIM barrel-domain containing protein [Actinomyces vulturis]|uniref:glycoside hydrolase family 2 TIM barrel-domain containing protein n=1 Tax=Actinomyces vulturis TaxID=1857645 RepID=UPI00159ED39A|nr:glycoside hydrolase family 2 TIM barrel-domain containing protein [Actinomyces vulturis]